MVAIYKEKRKKLEAIENLIVAHDTALDKNKETL